MGRYGLKTGKPRRELGIISYKKKLLGPTEIIVVMPRVRKDGACAQFRPSQPEESMIQLYKAGRVEHMILLRGCFAVMACCAMTKPPYC